MNFFGGCSLSLSTQGGFSSQNAGSTVNNNATEESPIKADYFQPQFSYMGKENNYHPCNSLPNASDYFQGKAKIIAAIMQDQSESEVLRELYFIPTIAKNDRSSEELQGITLAWAAASKNYWESVKRMVEIGHPDINATPKNSKRTILWMAAKAKQWEIVYLIMKQHWNAIDVKAHPEGEESVALLVHKGGQGYLERVIKEWGRLDGKLS